MEGLGLAVAVAGVAAAKEHQVPALRLDGEDDLELEEDVGRGDLLDEESEVEMPGGADGAHRKAGP